MASNAAQAEAAQGKYGSMSNQLGLPENQEDWTDKDVEQLRSFLRDRRKLAQAVGYGNARCIDPEEAAEEAHTRATNVLQRWRTLNAIVSRHEEDLIDAWWNSSPSLRRKYLQQAWLGILDMHRPDLWALERETQEQRQAGTAYLDAFMWPQINLKDLNDQLRFLVFMNSRARSPPHVFAVADLETIRTGQLSKAIQGVFLPGHDMIMAGQTPETYGKLCPQREEENIKAKAKGASFKAGDGMDVLEVQERLLTFLITCSQSIVDDISIEDPKEPVLNMEKLGLQTTRSKDGYTNISEAMLEAPYIDPRDVDLERLETIVRNRLREAETHFRNLRQDPTYFATTVKNWVGKTIESLLTKENNVEQSDATDPSPRRKVLDRTIGRLVHNSYEEIHVWKHLALQLHELRDLQRQYPGNKTADVVSSEYMEHPQYMQALQKLKALIDMRLQNHYMMKINDHFVSSIPQLHKPIGEPRDASTGDPPEMPQDNLLRLWNHFNDKERLQVRGLKSLSNDMDSFIQQYPQEEPRLKLLEPAFRDIFMVGGLRELFTMLWPRIFAPRSDIDIANRPQIEVVRWGQQLVAPIWGLVQLLNDLNGTANPPIKLGEAGDPYNGRFDYSDPERRQSAETDLKSFWDGVERDLKALMPSKEYEALQELVAF